MPQFSQNSSVALTWSPDGECHGIRVKRVGDGCRVVAHWTDRADSNRSVGELLAAGAKALEAHDASYFGVASTGDGWGSADIQMPSLPAEQLRNALAFELQKHSPLGLERLVWGYRRLSRGGASGPAMYRVVYVRNDVWKVWCGIAAALAPLDALMPVPAALDPLFSGQQVAFSTGDGQADVYVPGPSGRIARRMAADGGDMSAQQFLEGIACKEIDWGELGALPSSERLGYVSALVLAVYGLTAEAPKDAQTILPLPASLRPHRSIFLVISACVLLGVALAALALNGVLRLQANYSQASQLRREIASVEKEINVKRSFIKNDRLKRLQELHEELKGEIPDYPPFPLALNDLSVIIDGDRECKPWISSKMVWSHDTNMLKFSVEEPMGEDAQKPLIEQPELLDALNDSPYILDARANSSTYNRAENKTVREFTIQLGWPDAAVRAEAAKRNQQRAQERRERARKAAADARAAKAAAEAAEAAEAKAAAEAAEDSAVEEQPADAGRGDVQAPVVPQEGAAPMTPPLPPGLPPVPAQP